MKNSKAKDGSRSSQIPSFQIYLTYPAFSHQNIFFNYILQVYSMREGFRNKHMSEKTKWPSGLRTPGACSRPTQAFQDMPTSLTGIQAFYVLFLLGLTFSRKRLCYSHDQPTTLPVQETWGKEGQTLLGLWDVGEEKSKSLILITEGEKKQTNKTQTNGTAASCTAQKHTRGHTHTHRQSKDTFFSFSWTWPQLGMESWPHCGV